MAPARELVFVRGAAHQLRAPLTVARGLAALLEPQLRGPAAHDDMRDLIEQLDVLDAMVSDLLLLATPRESVGLVREPVDFEDLVVSTARRWSRAVEGRRWTVAAEDGELAADRRRLESALDAVLENAVRATRDGDGISLVGRADRGWAVIEVADTGSGIPADLVPHVFEPFRRGDSPGGTGLGLAIARAVVEAHDGTIGIASSEGAGTTVTIRLPGLQPFGGMVPADISLGIRPT